MPSGNSVAIAFISFCTSRDTATLFARDNCSTASETESTPLERPMLRSFSAPTRTSATCPSLTCCPSGPRPTTNLAKSCATWKPVAVRNVNSRVVDSSRPAGNSTFSARRAFSISATVRPRAASAERDSQMRIA